MTRSIAACAVAAFACGGSSSSTPYKGVFAGPGGESGVLLAERLPHEFTVQATVLTGAQSIPISGSLDPVLGNFQINGSGYNFVGILKNDVILGGYTGPGGNGQFAVLTGTAVAALLCGTFAGTDSHGATSGVFNVVQGNAGVSAVAWYGAGSGGNAKGTSSATGFSASSSTTTITGSISGGGATGTYAALDGSSSGTFTATAAACPH